jgi:uncharacterized membrane protein YphA (DoxX/SURF4 family)
MNGPFGQKYSELTLNALRIVAGLLFMTHGGQKLFAWFGGGRWQLETRLRRRRA